MGRGVMRVLVTLLFGCHEASVTACYCHIPIITSLCGCHEPTVLCSPLMSPEPG